MTFSLTLGKILLVWLAADAVLLATIWYATTTIQPRWTEWWKAHICDYAPPGCVD